MNIHEISVGDCVYIYSENLDEVIQGSVEGFLDTKRLRVKILQKVPDGYLRHIVSWVYVFMDKESADICRNLYKRSAKLDLKHVISYSSGMTVKLISKTGDYVRDIEGNPLLYQIINVYKEERAVSLVTSYGELIGKYPWNSIEFHSNESLFQSKDYDIGQRVSWIDSDDVYEGIITKLNKSTAEVQNIKRLLPIDMKRLIPYYKIPSDLRGEKASQIITTLIGDNLED